MAEWLVTEDICKEDLKTFFKQLVYGDDVKDFISTALASGSPSTDICEFRSFIMSNRELLQAVTNMKMMLSQLPKNTVVSEIASDLVSDNVSIPLSSNLVPNDKEQSTSEESLHVTLIGSDSDENLVLINPKDLHK